MKRLSALWIPLLLALGLIGGILLDRSVLVAFVPPDNIPPAAVPAFRLMAEAWNTVERYYVDRSALQPDRLGYGAISGMVDALGDTGHSRFLSPALARAENDYTHGQIEGIGAEIQMKDGRLVVVAPLDGSPAQRAGL